MILAALILLLGSGDSLHCDPDAVSRRHAASHARSAGAAVLQVHARTASESAFRRRSFDIFAVEAHLSGALRHRGHRAGDRRGHAFVSGDSRERDCRLAADDALRVSDSAASFPPDIGPLDRDAHAVLRGRGTGDPPAGARAELSALASRHHRRRRRSATNQPRPPKISRL